MSNGSVSEEQGQAKKYVRPVGADPKLHHFGQVIETDSIVRTFPTWTGPALQQAWPAVESALDEYDITCALYVEHGFIRISLLSNADPDVVHRATSFLDLLSLTVAPSRALQVLRGRNCDVIKTGHQSDGLCSKYGITEDQFAARGKLLMGSLKELINVTCCEICFRDDVVVAIGASQGLKLARKIVEDCIVHNVPPASSIERVKTTGVTRSLEALHLE